MVSLLELRQLSHELAVAADNVRLIRNQARNRFDGLRIDLLLSSILRLLLLLLSLLLLLLSLQKREQLLSLLALLAKLRQLRAITHDT